MGREQYADVRRPAGYDNLRNIIAAQPLLEVRFEETRALWFEDNTFLFRVDRIYDGTPFSARGRLFKKLIDVRDAPLVIVIHVKDGFTIVKIGLLEIGDVFDYKSSLRIELIPVLELEIRDHVNDQQCSPSGHNFDIYKNAAGVLVRRLILHAGPISWPLKADPSRPRTLPPCRPFSQNQFSQHRPALRHQPALLP